MDNKTQNILQKFSKQKVQLKNVADDIIKDRMGVGAGEIYDSLLPLNNQAQKSESQLLKIQQKLKSAKKELDVFEKKVKDLGINDDKDISIANNKIKLNLDRIKKAIKIARAAKEEIK